MKSEVVPSPNNQQRKAVRTMTTERHAWASARIAQRDLPTLHQVSPICGCGQDLDVCTGTHCPRCGTSLIGHAA
jgi:hypothetical protein